MEENWTPPPSNITPLGRFNHRKEPKLYVGSDEEIIKREKNIKKGDFYWLATYKVNSSFDVGSFLVNDNEIATYLHIVAMILESQDKLLDTEKEVLKKHLERTKEYNMGIFDPLLSLYAVDKMSYNLYNITNKIGKLASNENGLRFCSSYTPLEFSGADECLTLNGELYANYVFTKKGFKYLDLIDVKRKVCEDVTDYSKMIKISSDVIVDLLHKKFGATDITKK